MNILNRNIFFSNNDKTIVYDILNGLNINITEQELNLILNRNLIFPQDKELIRNEHYNNLLYFLMILDLIYHTIQTKRQKPKLLETEQQILTEQKFPIKEIEQVPIDPTNDLFYDDPINYNSEEIGKNYKIKIKPEVATKIVSVTLVRDNRRNPRFAEYYSGLLCEISNIKKVLGPEWGVRIYIDSNNLRRSIITEHIDFGRMESNYGLNEWINFFRPENKNPEEGIFFYKLYKILNELDFVGVYKVQLNDEFIDPITKYPYQLIATNYRYHATYDINKEVVIVKNVGFHIMDYPDTAKVSQWVINFESSNKTATYFLLPWYKPKHGLLNDPYTIIAFYLGTKPKIINYFQYNLDSILDYLRSYDVDPNNFFGRTVGNNINDRNIYGGDEIVLNDHIFITFPASSIYPIAHWSLRHKLVIFFILYEKFKNVPEFNTDMQINFQRLKDVLKEDEMKKDNNIKFLNEKIILFNYTDLNSFLFGDNLYFKYCCIFPLYNTIPNKELVIAYYIAYINTCSDITYMKYMVDYANNNIHEYLVNSIKRYMVNQMGTRYSIDIIDRTIFAMTCTNNMMFESSYPYYHMPDSIYWFNVYYIAEQHINNHMYWEYLTENRVYTEFLNNINTKWLVRYNELQKEIQLYIVPDNLTDAPMTTPHRDYFKCVPDFFNTLVGGSSSYGEKINIDCERGLKVGNIVIQDIITSKQTYVNIVPDSLLPIKGGSNKLDKVDNIYLYKYMKYKRKYLNVKYINIEYNK